MQFNDSTDESSAHGAREDQPYVSHYDDDDDWDDYCRRATEYADHPEPTQQVIAEAVATRSGYVPGATLPAEFWDARPYLKHIRTAAHSQVRSADAALGCVLARIASMCSPDLKFDFGLREGSLNLGVGLYGPPGMGKSESNGVASDLLPVPYHLSMPGMYRDGLDIGTGEGMCEAYMGFVDQEEEVESGSAGGRKVKIKQAKVQVRRNVFFYVDEAVSLVTKMDRRDATLGPTLRSAFFGQALGSANASAETTRYLAKFSYAMGMVVGFQQEPAAKLMSDVGTGTPQRFVWLATKDPSVPNPLDSELEWPGALNIYLTDERGEPLRGVITCPEELRRKLRYEQWERSQPDGPVLAEIDSHLSYLQCKLASLLTIMDGRRKANWDDWKLAGMIMDVSNATRDRIIAYANQTRDDQAEKRMVNAVESAVRTKLAVEQVDVKVEKYATRIAERVASGKVGTRRSVANDIFGASTRHWMDPALEYAIRREWITEEHGVLVPGKSRPAGSVGR